MVPLTLRVSKVASHLAWASLAPVPLYTATAARWPAFSPHAIGQTGAGTRLFVLTLGCSRKAIRLLVFRSSARVWAELHEKAFRRLGGSLRVVVLDNLREGVLSPDF